MASVVLRTAATQELSMLVKMAFDLIPSSMVLAQLVLDLMPSNMPLNPYSLLFLGLQEVSLS
jgi:hypothetical protein